MWMITPEPCSIIGGRSSRSRRTAARRFGYVGCDELVGVTLIFGSRARCREDPCARLAERCNDRRTDTLGATGDERAFSFELQVVAHP